MTFFSDTYYMFLRWMKKLYRNPILLFFSLFQPIIFLLLFTQLFGKFGLLLGTNYTVFATAGIVLQNAFSSAFQSGTAVVDDIKSGYLTKILATPASRASILLGRILSDAFRVFAQTLIILLLAYGLGVFPATGIIGYILILITVAFFGLAWSGISLALGLRTALVQQRLMPDWMQTVSSYNPISFAVNAIRDLIVTGYVWNSFSEAYVVISLIAVLTLGATFYEFRKIVS
jgi:ABC-2 type transport system permease protein